MACHMRRIRQKTLPGTDNNLLITFRKVIFLCSFFMNECLFSMHLENFTFPHWSNKGISTYSGVSDPVHVWYPIAFGYLMAANRLYFYFKVNRMFSSMTSSFCLFKTSLKILFCSLGLIYFFFTLVIFPILAFRDVVF